MLKPRFRIRTRLFVVFLCSLPLFGRRLYIASLQRQYDVVYRLVACEPFSIYHEPMWPQWFWRPLAGKAAISVVGAHLSCWDCADLNLITENEISVIESWDLKGGLSLKSKLIDDAVFHRLCGMRRATSLIVEDSMVTDAGLSSLPELAAARYLVIDTRMSITDKGMADIVKMPALDNVQLSGRGGLPLTDIVINGVRVDPEVYRHPANPAF
jgi:hypothetical protein